MKPFIIAIDGPAASGKGTVAKRLAQRYGLRHLDTGLLYRGVAHALVEQGAPLDEEERAAEAARNLDPARFDESKLKTHAMGEAASVVSALPQVRAALVALQRDFARAGTGAVLDGRDIGTVICPDADVKIFITASPEERARRRAAELASLGTAVSESEVRAEIARRDARDENRAIAPLRPAADAHLLDTTHLDIDAAVRAAVAIVESARGKRGA